VLCKVASLHASPSSSLAQDPRFSIGGPGLSFRALPAQAPYDLPTLTSRHPPAPASPFAARRSADRGRCQQAAVAPMTTEEPGSDLCGLGYCPTSEKRSPSSRPDRGIMPLPFTGFLVDVSGVVPSGSGSPFRQRDASPWCASAPKGVSCQWTKPSSVSVPAMPSERGSFRLALPIARGADPASVSGVPSVTF
jgi:hypothetical protein